MPELDVDDFLSGTVFAGAPMVPVSSKTGEGIDALLAALDDQVGACWDSCRDRAERTDAAPRLPIDRCFTIKGAGTVVTGTLHDAPVAVGDELVALRRARPAAYAGSKCMATRSRRFPVSVWRSTWLVTASPRSIAVRCSVWRVALARRCAL